MPFESGQCAFNGYKKKLIPDEQRLNEYLKFTAMTISLAIFCTPVVVPMVNIQ